MIDYFASPASPDATAGIFGADDGSKAFSLKQITASTEIRGRANTLSSDEVVETTDNFVVGHSYGLQVEGTSEQILKDAVAYGSPLTIVGAQALCSQEIAPGGIISGGSIGNMRPVDFRWMTAFKSTTVDKAVLNAALNTWVS
jgi:hypothetical protein